MPLLRKYHKLCLLFPVLCLISFKDLQGQVPTITSFLPISAKPGMAVTLTRTNFNTTVDQILFSE